MPADPKSTLKTYIDARREALISKVEDLSEREARLPRTPTGTNLIGIIKHVIGVEAVYLGSTFDRPYPHPEELISGEDFEVDPQADWYATENETVAGIIERYRRVIAHGNETIDALPIDAVGHVPHWGGEEVTLHQMLVHLFADLAGHCGQADILREEVDGAVGWRKPGDNIPSEYDWPGYVAKLTEIANKF
ncbi:DinB family protein [Nocardioides sp. NBC_00368]|uniref:DinB family protein n=1 Tax=Nocardioides sp. NBC_00368 TaxID=2976000 RepID=UPI002E22F7A2